MVFSSPIFLFLFLPVVLSVYFIIPKVSRNYFLLLASLLFYFWGEHVYALIIIISTSFNYFFGFLLQKFEHKRDKKIIVTGALIFNIGLLCYFKYGNFLIDNINLCLPLFQLKKIECPDIHLPLGISFFTFQAISYVIDIYREEYRPHKNPIYSMLYISFFPQLIAGPIVRYNHIAHSLLKRSVTATGFAEGVNRFVVGLAKKVLIANTLAVPADAIFSIPAQNLSCSVAWIGALCYTLQIYFDFSGYSDMAIGLGKMLGFSFNENFNYPYISKSIREFWKRWHISMTTWFRDYLYIPLGGNRATSARLLFNLVVVFFLSGLWHGASWTFVIWGLYHGFFLVIERIGSKFSFVRRWKPLQHAYVLLVVMIGWVFFRATTLDQAVSMIGTMIGFSTGGEYVYGPAMYVDKVVLIAIILGMMGAMPVKGLILRLYEKISCQSSGTRAAIISKGFWGLNMIGMTILFLLVSMQLYSQTYNPFIYFRF